VVCNEKKENCKNNFGIKIVFLPKIRLMPEISSFLGIIITMNFSDHDPPHFHVRYNEFEASIRIKDLGIMIGDLPPKTFGLVAEWAKMHQEELMLCWEEAKKGNLVKIKPL
jgi:hypothetical protein